MHNICPITNDANFDCLINVMYALLLHFEVILPFYLINILWRFFEAMQKAMQFTHFSSSFQFTYVYIYIN